jgi:hypothetical protein
VRQWGRFPTVIEPLAGPLFLHNLKGGEAVTVQPLAAEGRPLGTPREAERTNLGWEIPLGDPPATWYVVEVAR